MSKEDILSTLLALPVGEALGSGYSVLPRETHHTLIRAIKPFMDHMDVAFSIDLKRFFPEIAFQSYALAPKTEALTHKRQTGGDFYTYEKIRVEAVDKGMVCIEEDLPEVLGTYAQKPKYQSIDWAIVYPFVLKAYLDACITQKYVGIGFTLLDIRFHPMDFRPYTYYACTRRLLTKLWSVSSV